MQSKPFQVFFLEDWLPPNPPPTTTKPPPTSAQSILRSWAHLRDPTTLSSSDPSLLLSSLETLSSLSKTSLHISDPQAKLLLSLLSSLPPDSLSPLFRLLYAYLRKSPRPNLPLIESSLPLLSSLPPSSWPSDGILLIGAISAVPSLSDSSRKAALDLLCHLLQIQPHPKNDNFLPQLLAGIGYALSRADDAHFSTIFCHLLHIWDDAGGGGTPISVHSGLILLRLVEWVLTGFVHLRDFKRISFVSRELCSDGYGRFVVLMSAAGILRSFRMSSGFLPDSRMRSSLEGVIRKVAEYVVATGGDDSERKVLVQCIALALVRCGPVAFHGPVFLCLCSGLLEHIFPLKYLLRMAVEDLEADSAVREHLGSILFKEAGAVTGVFCNQYGVADEKHKFSAESSVWKYSQELYADLRKAVYVNRGKNRELVGDLEKIAEAAFLMVVVFSAEVTKHKLNPKSNNGIRPEVSVDILIAFSCLEYLRRVRLPEYTDAVRHAVLTIQEDAAACALFVESMPPYAELTNQQGSHAMEGVKYVWWEDDVQTARVLFFMRVIPTCMSLVPASMFAKLVAPMMFLYMQHPNEKVARASHSVFIAFTSSAKDSEQDERSSVKEKLVFYYMQRALEAYPGVTPFEGLASGVAALVRHLPAGSPAIFYCVHSLVGKATELCKEALSEDETMWKTWEGSSEPCKKVLDLLLRLMALVDIQVLPYLLKQLAEFVIQLPREGQDVLLDEMYSQVAESDDVTRKPVFVSWLQSLSYLCSQKNNKKSSTKNGSDNEPGVASLSTDESTLSLKGTLARL